MMYSYLRENLTQSMEQIALLCFTITGMFEQLEICSGTHTTKQKVFACEEWRVRHKEKLGDPHCAVRTYGPANTEIHVTGIQSWIT